jgi:putative ABC transport system permease protein
VSLLRSWRVPLRIARREARRARGRSILVLVMIALPVLAISAADVAMHTQDVHGTESLDRRLGAASAFVQTQEGVGHVFQGADPEASEASDGATGVSLATAAFVSSTLGGAKLVAARTGDIRVASHDGVALAAGTEVDLRDPVVHGLFDLTSGRLPRSPDEVVVNAALAAKGYAIGDRLDLGTTSGVRPEIVGIAESTTIRSQPVAVGPLGSLGLPHEGVASWYVGGGPVSWSQVRTLNQHGASVLSRAVMLHPPSRSQIPDEVGSTGGGPAAATVATATLVAVMVLLEVVLLAGPAFAVGARRQARSLALLAAAGGTPRQARQVVLASAVVLGSLAALIGTVLGIGTAVLALPLLQRLSGSWFGPFEVPWLQLLGVAALGVLSALLAAVVPAWIASRQDVVAVLAGRRGDRQPSRRSPWIGVALLGAGVVGAALGATRSGSENLIAASAIFSVLGMILLAPVAVATVARMSARWPLSLRYAARDAARHRTRTVPAIAAVAATVAGVVALGIGSSSDARENRENYLSYSAMGVGSLADYGTKTDWPALRASVEREVPEADVHDVRGVPLSRDDGGSLEVDVSAGAGAPLLVSYGSSLGSDVLVASAALPPGLPGVSRAEEDRAAAALRGGDVVAFTSRAVSAHTRPVRVTVTDYSPDSDKSTTLARLHLTATLVDVGRHAMGPELVVSDAVAKRLRLPVTQVGLVLDGTTISPQQETKVTEAVQAISRDASFSVERGYHNDDQDRIMLLVLAALGAALMLGGTLTATFLALSDARPDLATLSAVGASPTTRRGVAAAYALVVGAVGASLGAVVGFIPGLAITFPLTQTNGADGVTTGPFIDVPWLLVLGLVVLLPLLTAAIVGVTARPRLPLVARLD